MNKTGTPPFPPQARPAPEGAMQLFQEALRQLEALHPEGVTIEQLQELANQVTAEYYARQLRPDDGAPDRR